MYRRLKIGHAEAAIARSLCSSLGRDVSSGDHGSLFRSQASSIALTRRQFLIDCVGVGAFACGASSYASVVNTLTPKRRKTVVVTFGGGARDDETFAPLGQRNIPCLIKELIPKATFYTQVVNEGILGHYVATASLVTGVYERFNNFAAVRPDNPTVFEYFNHGLKNRPEDAWVVAPSDGFAQIGLSSHGKFGVRGARTLLPKRLLAKIAKSQTGEFKTLLQDNYENPYYAPENLVSDDVFSTLENDLGMTEEEFRKAALASASPDELSVLLVQRLMKKTAPSFLWVVLHDIDIAHSGAYSLYLDGIRRSDRLCLDLWQTIQQNPEYADQTNMFILPDFGRDSDLSPSGNGFQHHRTGDALSRTTWLMALGPGVPENVVIDRRVESIDLVPTIASMRGFEAPLSKANLLREIL